MNLNSRVPVWMLVLTVIFALSSLVFTVANAVTEYEIVKPLLMTFSTKATKLRMENLRFSYNVDHHTWDGARFDVFNYGARASNFTVTILMIGQAGTLAEGSGTYDRVYPLTILQNCTLTINWVEGRSIDEITRVEVIIMEVR